MGDVFSGIGDAIGSVVGLATGNPLPAIGSIAGAIGGGLSGAGDVVSAVGPAFANAGVNQPSFNGINLPGQSGVANSFLGNLGQQNALAGQAGQVPSILMDIFRQNQQTPYYQNTQAFANMAQGVGQQQVETQHNYQNQLGSTANRLFDNAFDPQRALYDRTLGQVTDQTRSGLAARGLDSSGAGQGIENEALRNFNIDWQNNQLQRQVQGERGIANSLGLAQNIGNALPALANQAGQYPQQAYDQYMARLYGNAQSLQQGLGGQQSLFANPNQQSLSYLNQGQNSASNLFNAQTQQAQGQVNANTNLFKGIGTGISSLGNGISAFNNSGVFQPTVQSNPLNFGFQQNQYGSYGGSQGQGPLLSYGNGP